MPFSSLPQEIALQVFQKLLPDEAQTLLVRLKGAEGSQPVRLLHARLFLAHLVLYTSELPPHYDFAATPEVFLALANEPGFVGNPPKRLDIVLIRRARDYTIFQKNLEAVGEILEAPWAQKYFAAIPHLTFCIDGRAVMVESPTLLLVQVLNTLVKLAAHSKTNLRMLTITATDIGEVFPQKWGRVLGGFSAVEELTLVDNLLRLNLPGVEDERVLERHFTWPPQLTKLLLARNLLTNFTLATIKRLPSLLVTLDLSLNSIRCMGAPYDTPFRIVEHLPNLRLLDLSSNAYLTLFDAGILCGAKRLQVVLLGCNIEELCMAQIKAVAVREGLVVV